MGKGTPEKVQNMIDNIPKRSHRASRIDRPQALKQLLASGNQA
jgi:hypothetical protein